MNEPKELTGVRKGLLIIGERFRKNNKIYYECTCDCGKKVEVFKGDLTREKHQESCGCLKFKQFGDRNRKHGLAESRFYRIWANMKGRIYKTYHISYKNYGGRGIKVCDRWEVFQGFKDDMYASYLEHVESHGEKDTTLERKDANGNYTLDNCIWATNLEQKNNQRRHKLFKATNIETGEVFYDISKTNFAEKHGVTRQHITKVLSGERKHSNGFYFEYVKNETILEDHA